MKRAIFRTAAFAVTLLALGACERAALAPEPAAASLDGRTYFAVTLQAITLGTRVSWNNVNADHYEVYRAVLPSGGSWGPFVHLGNTTALSRDDGAYRPAHHSDYTHVVQYKVIARWACCELEHTVGTFAKSTYLAPLPGPR